LVLDKGEVKEQGNHQQLLENKGIYANLWAIQQRKTELKQTGLDHVIN
jgi:ABC-type multidrug transport system fused ATPase/permease subunit